jgi:phosphatidylinositol alpha-1,6-mannosyltransferase
MEFVFCPVGDPPSDGEVGDYATLHAAPIRLRTQQLAYKMASRPSLHHLLEVFITAKMRGGLKTLRKRDDISAIHFVGTGWDLSGFALLELAHRLRIPFTVWPAVHPGSWGDDIIDVRLYQGADTVFCQTLSEAQHLVHKGISRDSVSICGLPPNVSCNGNGAALRAKLGIGGRPVVFFMGRRDEGKGYHALLEAWPQVLARIPDTVLLLAGKGGDEYTSLVHQLPADSCRDLGIVDDSTKADALAACDVFCLPSAHESFGIVYVEAWSYGKPVICGTAPACRELVEDGMTGLHATQDPAELATKTVLLLQNSTKARKMGKNGLRLQQEKFTERRLLDSHIKAWTALDNESHASRC